MRRLRPTVVEVDLDAIRHNVRLLKPADGELMAVLKANAYGHGAAEVARAALGAGATWIGVALVEEGVSLREAGIEVPILVLSEFPAGSEREALRADLTPSLYTEGGLQRLREAADGRRVDVHVKVDTGMHRVGVFPPESLNSYLDQVAEEGFGLDAIWTHFADSAEDEATTRRQLERFFGVVEAARAGGHDPRMLHAANSGATLLYPESHLSLVRCGIAVMGLEPAPGVGASDGLRPALTWRSAVSMTKRLPAGEPVSYGHRHRLEHDANVATVPVGYADGYPRLLSSRADVLIRGRRCLVAGSVTMDQLIVDCGDLEIEAGDDVVLLGRQDDEVVSAWELAERSETIGYEIVSRIGDRVPREYRG